jgi:hypothetical protein
MPTQQIVALLIDERNRLDAAIQDLQGPVKRRGRLPQSAASSSPQQRSRLSASVF